MEHFAGIDVSLEETACAWLMERPDRQGDACGERAGGAGQRSSPSRACGWRASAWKRARCRNGYTLAWSRRVCRRSCSRRGM